MKYIFSFLIFFSTLLNANILINNNTNELEILPYSKIYIDNTKKLTLEEVKIKEFQDNDEVFLAYGYAPPFVVWIKFTLKNNTDKVISKILQYDHEITTNIALYDQDNIYKEGILERLIPRESLNPKFILELEPNQTRTYYIQASSYVTPLLVKLNIWDISNFYIKEINHQIILSLFFGAMGILALYNLFIFFSTKDISYFWYVVYIVGTIIHHIFYVGMIYRFETNSITDFIGTDGAYIIVTLPFIAVGYFSKYFLNMKQYPKLDRILNFYIFSIILLVVFGLYFKFIAAWQNLYYITFVFFLFFIACYGVYKKNRQAYFVVVGWLALYTSWMLMYLSSMGIWQVFYHYPYIVEVGILLEALIFSFALAHRIKSTNKEKELAHQKLIEQQLSEEKRLQKEVELKTKSLNLALNEKNTLLKELHHRVKNNMQMVVSLLRLQSNEIEDKRLQDIFKNAQNRISSMGHLHELLYTQDSFTHINSYEYFSLLIEEISQTYQKNVDIDYSIKCDIKIEDAIYCGLIINELVSNSFKYAFGDIKKPKIKIELYIQDDKYILKVEDNGVGYKKKSGTNSLGLLLVDSLVTRQLKGKIDTNLLDGVKVKINWNKK